MAGLREDEKSEKSEGFDWDIVGEISRVLASRHPKELPCTLHGLFDRTVKERHLIDSVLGRSMLSIITLISSR
jgi:hypothetical protein